MLMGKLWGPLIKIYKHIKQEPDFLSLASTPTYKMENALYI